MSTAIDRSRAVKPIDCWWTVAVIDPVAVRVLPAIVGRRSITPNGITAVAFVVGGVSVGLFAAGHLVAGAVCYELRFFLDCLDGKLARVRRQSSPFGAAFDRLADSITVPAAYAAIGWTLAERHAWSHTWVFAVALMAAMVMVCELSLDTAKATVGHAPASSTPDQPAAGVVAWMRRHRLTLRPWTVEAETVGLFLGPLLLHGKSLAQVQWAIAAVYVVFAVADVMLMVRVFTSGGSRRSSS
ncbi:MAG: CDP-alcohol phosphatidyltransferase family protein [Frankiaceae bacterium]|nr:CDP-alcohol phosphatidyltransferase family protein [Frankiaceae bacterium]